MADIFSDRAGRKADKVMDRIPPERLQQVLATACSIAPQTEQKDLAYQLGGY